MLGEDFDERPPNVHFPIACSRCRQSDDVQPGDLSGQITERPAAAWESATVVTHQKHSEGCRESREGRPTGRGGEDHDEGECAD